MQLQIVQDVAAGKQDHKQRGAECLLCIMSLLSALLSRLDHVDKYESCGNLQPRLLAVSCNQCVTYTPGSCTMILTCRACRSICDEMEKDLVSLIQRHLYSQVLLPAMWCLCCSPPA